MSSSSSTANLGLDVNDYVEFLGIDRPDPAYDVGRVVAVGEFLVRVKWARAAISYSEARAQLRKLDPATVSAEDREACK